MDYKMCLSSFEQSRFMVVKYKLARLHSHMLGRLGKEPEHLTLRPATQSIIYRELNVIN